MKTRLLSLLSLLIFTIGLSAQTVVTMPNVDGKQQVVNVTDAVIFYDAGGENGNIPNYQITGITFAPKAGEKIEITFEDIDLQNGALIKIFDGIKSLDSYYDDIDDETYYTIPQGHRIALSGTKTNEVVTSEATDGKLTIFFQNSNGTGNGWKATVVSVPGEPLPEDEVRIGISPSPQTVGGTSLNFYDDGGKDGNISLNFNGKITFKPATPGNKVKIEFTKLTLFNTSTIEKNDILKIYSGTETVDANLLATLLKDPTPVTLKSVADDGSLTVTLVSTTGISKPGFEAVVSEFTPQSMSFSDITLAQVTQPTAAAGDKDQAILSINVKTNDDLNPLTVSKFSFNTNGSFANIEKATVYYTGKNNIFSTAKKVGEINVTSDNFEVDCAVPQPLIEGNNYFWLAYELKTTAKAGETFDAGCSAVTVGGTDKTVDLTQPDGNRTIKNEYVSTIGKAEKVVFDTWTYTHTPDPYRAGYKRETGDQIITFIPATPGKVIEINFQDFDVYYATASYGVKAKFQIFSGKDITGDKLWEVDATNNKVGPGKTLRSKSVDGAMTVVFNANDNTRNAEGWHATVSEYLPKNMELTSVEVIQANTDIIKPGSVNQEMIGVQIITSGDLTHLDLNALTVNLKDSHDKIRKVSVFATQDKNAFATTTLVASLTAPATDEVTLTFDTPLTLLEGSNYLWVAYDMNDELASDLVVDASLTNIKIGGETKTPLNGDPEGERVTKNIFEMSAGAHTVNVASSMMFYDNGGANANYKKGEKEVVTFIPKTGQVIKLIFKSFNTRYNDYLYVYDGNSETAPEIAKLSGGSSLPENILSTAEDGSLTLAFTPTTTYNSGWEIEVQSYTPLPLTVTKVTSTVASTDKLLKGAQDEQMLKIEITVGGDKGNINLSSFSFLPENTSNIADIASANLYSTGTNNAFAITDKYAASLTGSPFTFNGNTAITKAGTYYYWLTYDVAKTAALNNVLVAKLTTVAQDGNALTLSENTENTRSVQAGFSGTYTIGTSSTANYKTFAAAIDAMKNGIDGKVVFEIENGTYTELVKIPHIAGASAENTITFKSKSGTATDVVLEVNTYKSVPYGEEEFGVLSVNGADYISIEGISVRTSQNQYPAVVLIKNTSNHVTLKNCVIQSPRTTSVTGDIALVRVEGIDKVNQNCDYFTLENCVMDGGYSGAYIYGTGYVSLPKQVGARIVGNTFLNQGSVAVYMTKENGGIIENNIISITGSTASTFKGIDAVMMGNTIIRGNKINADATVSGSVNGFYLRRRDDKETIEGNSKIYNNEIIINNAKGSTHYGIYCSDAITNTDVVYNSVNITKTATTQNSAPFYIPGTATKPPVAVTIENNLFQNNAGGYVYRVNNAASFGGMTFSNNALYTTGTTFAYGGAAITTFDDWNTASNETNSIVEKAEFISEKSLDLKTAGKLIAAKPLDYVTTDINGTARNVATPTFGAYEYADVAMPVMAEGYPQVVNITHNSADVKIKLTENGKIFILAKKADEPMPTQAEVLAAQTKDVAKNAEVLLPLVSLQSLTEYKAYIVLQSLNAESSAVIETETFKTEFAPTEVSTFENVTAAGSSFTDGTASFDGFKIVPITDGQGANNKKAAQLESNGVVNITNNTNGLMLNGFYLKTDKPVTLTLKKGTEEKGVRTLDATNDKWVFINLKDAGEITSVSFAGTGTTLIDNFSGTPQPITFMLEDKTVKQGESTAIESDIYGGVLPYSYSWTNAKQEVLSTEANLTLKPEQTSVITLTVTDAWGNSANSSSLVTVLGTAKVATFDDLYLEPESRWWGNPDQMISTFYSGSYSFTNTLIEEYNTWGGFAYSNFTSTEFKGLQDQFNSAVGHGVNDSENYAVVYTLGAQTKASVTSNPEGEVISGFYISNTAWVKDASLHGTGMASDDDPSGKKPFGVGDWYKITATGDNGKTLDFYLADYRSDNTNNHYTLDSWEWFDLRPLGKVKSVTFKADGTRRNSSGSTIPFYFCMDDFGGERKLTNAPKQAAKPNETMSITLADLFEPANATADANYLITDNINSTLGTAAIENGTLKITGIAEGETNLVIQRTIKGKSKFFQVPVEFTIATDVEGINKENTLLKVYPNPATLFISLNATGRVEIYSTNGNKVYENTRYTSGEQINVSHLANGVYFVKADNKTIKLIKQ